MENYNIYNEIGRGQHSFVYKARRKRSIDYVAVKSTAKSRMEKILNEVPFLHKLDSPYVLKFFDWYESSNHIWLILEYCMGGDLLNLITQDKQLPESVVKSFGLELVAGLQYLHSNSILYCDLKPANVLIDEFGSLKLADFGLARRIPESDAAVPSRPLAPGSPHYMAPELFQQTAVHSFASDFWALGCVLFELRTGQQPFTHTNFSQLARKIQTEVVKLPVPGCEMSLDFCNLLTRLLTKDPYERITWKELVDHPFWDNLPRLEHVNMPSQERFQRHSPLSLHNQPACSKEDEKKCNISRLKSNDSDEVDDNANALEPEAYAEDEQQPQTNEFETATTDDETEMSDSGTLRHKTATAIEITMTHENSRPVTAPVLRRRQSQINSKDIADDMLVQVELSSESNPMAGIRHRWRTLPAPRSAPSDLRRRPKRRLQLSTLCDQQGESGYSLRKMSKLVFTAADCCVKSIIGNHDVKLENLPDVKADLLRFPLIEPERLLLSSKTETVETQLKEIYLSLKSFDADKSEKLCCMAYLFSLSSHTQLAHVIVNSSMLKLLIRMLAQETQLSTSDKTMLSMLCLVLGTLFRFATIVASSSPDQLRLLVGLLLDIIVASAPKEINSAGKSALQARLLALACLGEVLFYIMTQQEWELPTEGVETVLACIEDQNITARYYAVRTLSNLLIHCPESFLPNIMSDHTVLALIRGLLECNSLEFDEQRQVNAQGLRVALRTCLTEALAHILRHLRTPSSSAHLCSRLKRSIMLYFAKPEILNAVWRGVGTQESSDLTIASLNIINAFLDIKVSRDSEAEYVAIKSSRTLLLERIVVLSTIQKAMQIDRLAGDDDDERKCLATVRAKCLIMLHLGIQVSREFLFSFVQSNVLVLVERMMEQIVDQVSARKRFSSPQSVTHLSAYEMYLTQCTLNICKLVIRIALKLGADCFSTHEHGSGEGRRHDNISGYASRISPLPFQLFRALLRHSNCRQQFFTYFLTSDSKQFAFFLRLMTKLLSSFSHDILAIEGESKTEKTVARFVSDILQHLFHYAATEAHELLVIERRELFTHLLPAVVKHVDIEEDLASDRDHHVAVTCLEVLRIVLLNFNDDGDGEVPDVFVRSILLPHFSKLLRKRHVLVEKIWTLSSDLLFGLLSRQKSLSLIEAKEDLNLVPTIVGLLCIPPTFKSLPLHATQLVQMLVDACDGNYECLFESGMAQAVLTGLTFAAKRNITDENLLDLVAILLTLLHHQVVTMRQQNQAPALADFDDLVTCGPLLLQFCAWSLEQPQSVQLENDTDRCNLNSELANLASRCLVLLSQISGERLNEVLVKHSKASESGESVMSWILSCLQADDISDDDMDEDGVVVLRVLLTLQNCLRCQGNNDFMSHWMAENVAFLNVVRSLAVRKQPSRIKEAPTQSTRPSIQEQIRKTAAAIERLCRAV